MPRLTSIDQILRHPARRMHPRSQEAVAVDFLFQCHSEAGEFHAKDSYIEAKFLDGDPLPFQYHDLNVTAFVALATVVDLDKNPELDQAVKGIYSSAKHYISGMTSATYRQLKATMHRSMKVHARRALSRKRAAMNERGIDPRYLLLVRRAREEMEKLQRKLSIADGQGGWLADEKQMAIRKYMEASQWMRSHKAEALNSVLRLWQWHDEMAANCRIIYGRLWPHLLREFDRVFGGCEPLTLAGPCSKCGKYYQVREGTRKAKYCSPRCCRLASSARWSSKQWRAQREDKLLRSKSRFLEWQSAGRKGDWKSAVHRKDQDISKKFLTRNKREITKRVHSGAS